MNGSVYDMLNQQNSFDDYVCISAITDADVQKKYETDGYYVGFTAEEWKSRFPSVPADKVICPKSLLFTGGLYYYDEDRSVCFNTGFVCGQRLSGRDMTDAELDKLFTDNIRTMEDAHANHDYSRLFCYVSSEGSGNMVMKMLISCLMHDEPNEKLYEAFIEQYSFCDCGSSLFTDADVFERLMACKSAKQKRATAKALSDFPDVIPVYRGEGSKSTPYTKAISWTTDLNKAFFFAGWRGGENARLITASVRKSDIIETITDRNESEVLILPKDILNPQIHPCVTMDMFEDGISGGVNGLKTTDFSEFCGHDLTESVHAVYDNFENAPDHDKEHTLRVSLFATFLFRVSDMFAETLTGTVSERDLVKIYSSLMNACIWHDTGRTDNSINATHGVRSCLLYRENNRPDKVAEFLMEYHCKSDDEAADYYRKHFSSKNSKWVWMAYEIMKDSDALDRCRFGNRSADYLDVSCLRTEAAKRLIPVAQSLQKYTLFPD